MGSAPKSRAIVGALTEHVGYKLGAFALAVALWVAASGEEPASRYVTVRFAPVLDSGVRIAGAAPSVRALVEGPSGELLKLYATPPTMRRAYPAEHDTTLRVELRAADVDLPSGVSRLRVRDVQPHALDLHLVGGLRRLTGPVRRALPATLATDTPAVVRVDSARTLP